MYQRVFQKPRLAPKAGYLLSQERVRVLRGGHYWRFTYLDTLFPPTCAQERAGAGVERPLSIQQGKGRDGDGAGAEVEGAHFPPHRTDDKRSPGAGRGAIQIHMSTSSN